MQLQSTLLNGEQIIHLVNEAEIKCELGTRKPEPDNAGVGIGLGFQNRNNGIFSSSSSLCRSTKESDQ
ncbi:hypothetical protein VAE151_500248 [Vibrio aestuarianus]|uniref:Uncharacterized protein n=1 Tax=Vibrio aestuarianus TaxID=28171 RepID=A0ABN8TNE9_9VIBR|nr:hypothetical protein VAE032_220249 [Vibrio aestuarianus]CAH8183943.1 hypothetical protein VAE055_320250 [Vibrio aestuarianus]CAH8184047.1 hypothetical protein VAE128_420250 [Vibrio aestuarianus]CAH8184087.1 hypothetical protein VAE130_530248 [Vibrio aestuarianus]CAH8184216.1 hypothetical protein VAE115_270250 [Vibrio aestuarianus]